MVSPANKILDKISSRQKKKFTMLTEVLDFARDFGALDMITGRDFEIRDPSGKLLATIRQKPVTVKVLNNCLQEFEKIKSRDADEKSAMMGIKKSGRRRK